MNKELNKMILKQVKPIKNIKTIGKMRMFESKRKLHNLVIAQTLTDFLSIRISSFPKLFTRYFNIVDAPANSVTKYFYQN